MDCPWCKQAVELETTDITVTPHTHRLDPCGHMVSCDLFAYLMTMERRASGELGPTELMFNGVCTMSSRKLAGIQARLREYRYARY